MMRDEFRRRWEREISNLDGQLKKPEDLIRRTLSSEGFLDSAVIGGVSVADIVHGKIAESQIPRDVLNAFHAQYPNQDGFVEAVRNHAGDPDAIRGLVNGVKGKLFELNYADWLNHGHLPDGYTAALAEHSNNPDWDIAIHDARGHVDHLLQAKASEALDYVREAVEAHPEIDAVVPHELYVEAAKYPDLLSHLVDSGQSLGGLNDHVQGAIDHADIGDVHFGLPLLGIAFAIGQNYIRYRRKACSFDEVLRNAKERIALAIIAKAAGWGAAALAHKTVVGIPVAVLTRIAGGQLLHNKHRREYLNASIESAKESIKRLLLEQVRPVVLIPASARTAGS